jgi:hypothetical protein
MRLALLGSARLARKKALWARRFAPLGSLRSHLYWVLCNLGQIKTKRTLQGL